MTLRHDSMVELRRRLSYLGVPKRFLDEKVLPDWWDDEIARVSAGYAQGLGYIARGLGLNVGWLHDSAHGEPFQDFGPTKFKKSEGVREEDLQWAKVIAARAARVTAEAYSGSNRVLPSEATAIRQEIVERHGHVSLESLLDFCWDCGVPVVHVGTFPRPKGQRKMDGLSAIFDGRPVIVLCRRNKSPSWLIFILAHELGHICLRHLDEVNGSGILIDETLEANERDDEEEQADRFACALIGGEEQPNYGTPKILTASQLAQFARDEGAQKHILPGFIALNHGHRHPDRWGAANGAVRSLEDHQDAVKVVHEKMLQRIDRERLPPETEEWLLRITEADGEEGVDGDE
jgi:Zn-dependent peptidase ImmA (M78 family)